MAIGLAHYLAVAAILFTIGVFGIFVNRKNIIVILMSIELILLAVNINLVAFSAYLDDLAGQIFAMFVLTVAAAEAAIGLAILVIYFRNRGTIAVDDVNRDEGLDDGCTRRHRLPAAARRPLIAGLFGRRHRRHGASELVTTGAAVRLGGCCRWSPSCQVALWAASPRRVHDPAPGSMSATSIADWALRIDTLTAVMLVVVTSVSALVHLYSIGYMAEDPHQPRFFAYLSLFTFAMLMLVTADNFMQLFFGWEGVGLASYLLIGFWYKKPSRQRRRDQGLRRQPRRRLRLRARHHGDLLVFGTLDFAAVFAAAAGHGRHDLRLRRLAAVDIMTTLCLLLFIGAMGKSAQFFLHTWLPDAMEGPTPVSALIHAATMVTAGVFLVCRCSPLFEYAPVALDIVTVIGAVTAFFAATVGLTQNDIKRVIAYSTCSQLGYMFFAAGVSAPISAAMFHLFTHAFFKALLFLGAGSVIHAMHHEQDMRNMGGLWQAPCPSPGR